MNSTDKAKGPGSVRPAVHYNRGISALKTGEASRAMAHFQEAIQADRMRGTVRPRVLFLSYYGFSRALAGSADREAIQACELAVARDSFDARVHLNLGRAYLLAGRTTRALAILERAKRLHPGDRAISALLAKADRRSQPLVTAFGRDNLLNRCLGRVRHTMGKSPRKSWDLAQAYRQTGTLNG